MNNRIFELAKQAELIQWDTLPSGAITPDYDSVVNAKKFAELIIQECGRVMEDVDGYYGEWMKTIIEEHFGIE